MDDQEDDFDISDDLLLAAVEKAENERSSVAPSAITTTTTNAAAAESSDEFDDWDNEDLILAAEAAEQRISQPQQQPQQRPPARPVERTPVAVQRPITASFPLDERAPVDDEQEPPAPAPPPPDTPCFHPFDRTTLPTWIYPVNYPVRSYQWNIVKKALFSNTLVALPTGLGKTFIAAVVMFNYWRWFPTSKIVFMAPTRPLVTQQIEACYSICGLPQTDTIELTGNLPPNQRRAFWMSKRVFFVTPQIMQNDLQSKICPAEKIVCLVVDEAHKATGNYAYTEVVKLVSKCHGEFRVLALTATPGTNIQGVQTVIDNLRIANVQIRTEDSMDIQQHMHGKNIQTRVVKLDYTAGGTGPVPRIASEFREKIFKPVLERLSRFQAIRSTDVERNTPYQLLLAQRAFNANARNFNNAVKGMVFVDFSIANALSRAYDMLCQHGIGPFLETIDNFLNEIKNVLDSGKSVPKEKYRLLNDHELKRLLDNVRAEQSRPGFVGHPKMDSLLNLVLQHLSDAPPNTDTKIMVFSSYRNSVDEIVKVLSEHQPLVRVSSFVGQAGGKNGTKGLNQREQQEIISRFRKGELNVLVSTSIGEEGLDIGEVDMIICYDSQSSPVRMLQRMGRTGRQRQGRCVMLMTEAEERKYRQAKNSYNNVQRAIASGRGLQFFRPDPSVLPEGYKPVWRKEKLVIGTYERPTSGRRRAQEAPIKADGTLSDEAAREFVQSINNREGEHFQNINQLFTRYWPTTDIMTRAQKYLPLNNRLTPFHKVGHSIRSMHFVQAVRAMERRILANGTSSQQANNVVAPHNAPLPSANDELILPRRTKRRADELEKAESSKRRRSIEAITELDNVLLQSEKAIYEGEFSGTSKRRLEDDAGSEESNKKQRKNEVELSSLGTELDSILLQTDEVVEQAYGDSPQRLWIPSQSSPRPTTPPPVLQEPNVVPAETQAADATKESDEFSDDMDNDYFAALADMPTPSSNKKKMPSSLDINAPFSFSDDDSQPLRQPDCPPNECQTSSAMLKWLTSRPTFSEAAKKFLYKRAYPSFVYQLLDLPYPPPLQKGLPKTPSFDEFDDIDESKLALMADVPVQKGNAEESTFAAVAHAPVQEDDCADKSEQHLVADAPVQKKDNDDKSELSFMAEASVHKDNAISESQQTFVYNFDSSEDEGNEAEAADGNPVTLASPKNVDVYNMAGRNIEIYTQYIPEDNQEREEARMHNSPVTNEPPMGDAVIINEEGSGKEVADSKPVTLASGGNGGRDEPRMDHLPMTNQERDATEAALNSPENSASDQCDYLYIWGGPEPAPDSQYFPDDPEKRRDPRLDRLLRDPSPIQNVETIDLRSDLSLPRNEERPAWPSPTDSDRYDAQWLLSPFPDENPAVASPQESDNACEDEPRMEEGDSFDDAFFEDAFTDLPMYPNDIEDNRPDVPPDNCGDERENKVDQEKEQPNSLPPSSPPYPDVASLEPLNEPRTLQRTPCEGDESGSSPFRPKMNRAKRKRFFFEDGMMSQPIRRPGELRGPPAAKRIKRNTDRPKMEHNPYLDVEAELSSDEEGRRACGDDGDEEEEEVENEEELARMDSFIYDGSSELGPTSCSTSNQPNSSPRVDIYRTSLLSPDTLRARGLVPMFMQQPGPARRTWLDKFESEKWMNEPVREEDEEDEGDEEDCKYHDASADLEAEIASDSDFA